MKQAIYDIFKNMEAGNIVLAYRGEINNDLLESVYSLVDKHFEEKKIPNDIRKKFFHILVEALQNIFHHQHVDKGIEKEPLTGFLISHSEGHYHIITGNYLLNSAKENLEKRINKVNSLSVSELKVHYQESLAGNEFSEKGGAGLGIIEMARKSGNKLNYEFINIDDTFSFFVLEITLNQAVQK